ncbi:SUF system Fe-S cluster assembly protein [candidate division KSB1 bacterium]|nr:SUF system Fe-S cluster assembly protein [candidate division KSB1 bacterium]
MANKSKDSILQDVLEVLQNCYDPEIPVNIYDLGLIYEVDLDETGKVKITMTLTSPACPVAESLPEEIKTMLLHVEGIKDVDVNVVWDPPWNIHMMSEEARLELDLL